MSDIDSLRQRIEQAELRLRTAHTARQRESAALITMWDQIRDRFSAQSAEIVQLRERVAALEDKRDALDGMVRTLLGAVENSIERMADETVPEITGLAETLLDSDPVAIVDIEPVEMPLPPPAIADKWGASRGAGDAAQKQTNDDFAMILSDTLGDGIPNPPAPPAADDDGDDDEPVSPGIRSLISRIEGAFERKAVAPLPLAEAEDEPAETPHDAELTRDLDDIRRLREELQSLRSRIGAGR